MRIALVGKKNSGKDEVYNALRALPNARFERVAFADPMKEMLCAGLGIPREVLWGNAAQKELVDPRYGVSVRHMLQTLGTEWGREMIHKDMWVKAALVGLERRALKDTDLNWVVTDVRFLNEASLLRAAGFIIWNIWRPDAATGVGEAHASEQEQDLIEWDRQLHNDGTLENLHMGARALFCLEQNQGAPRG